MLTGDEMERTYPSDRMSSGMGADDARTAAQRAAEKAGELKDRAIDTAEDLKDRAVDTAGEIRERTSQAVQQASEQLDSAMTATGERMTTLADTVRTNAPDGQLGTIATNAATMLDRSGDYLQRSNPQMVRGDLEEIIRKHPLESLAVGLGIGFLLAKSMKSRRSYYG